MQFQVCGKLEVRVTIPPPPFAVKVQFVTVGLATLFHIPAPAFPTKVQFTTTGALRSIAMPPPVPLRARFALKAQPAIRGCAPLKFPSPPPECATLLVKTQFRTIGPAAFR